MLFLAGIAGVIDINGSVIVELLTFLVMFGLLARYVYPEIVKQAEARQRVPAVHGDRNRVFGLRRERPRNGQRAGERGESHAATCASMRR